MSNTTTQKTIYLDYAATTPIDSTVLTEMAHVHSTVFGNASSMHHQGRRAFDILTQARKTIATSLKVQSDEIIFTGSGTESDNLAIMGIARAYQKYGRHIIVSSIEHKAVLASAQYLETQGFDVTYVPVDTDGLIAVEDCVAAIRPDTILVSIMYANNEIGTVQPIAELVQAIRHHQEPSAHTPVIHTDACQAVGMMPVTPSALGVDAMTINSSKIYGPKGVGLLYLKRGIHIEPIIVGGDQEMRKRAGTENVALIHGFAHALSTACQNQSKIHSQLTAVRDYFIDALMDMSSDIQLNGHREKRLPNNVHISIPNIEGESLVLHLDRYGICCSTGSACSAIDLEPSHVLRALHISDERIHGSLRFSIGKTTTQSDIDYTVHCLQQCIETLRKITILPNQWPQTTS